MIHLVVSPDNLSQVPVEHLLPLDESCGGQVPCPTSSVLGGPSPRPLPRATLNGELVVVVSPVAIVTLDVLLLAEHVGTGVHCLHLAEIAGLKGPVVEEREQLSYCM